MFIYLVHSLFRGKKAPGNPWGALTLDWSNPSPPPPENFAGTPELTHGPYDYDTVIAKRT
jgi:cytochrome c oxidase subunit 1